MKITLLHSFFLLSFMASLPLVYAQSESDKVMLAGHEGLSSYLEKIPPGNEIKYGFTSRDEFVTAGLGSPYQINVLNREFYTSSVLSAEKTYHTPAGEYRVPITVNGDFRAMLTVAWVNGNWKTVGLGAAGLAKELGTLEKNHPQLGPKIILRALQLDAEFVLVDDSSNGWGAWPLTSAKMALGKVTTLDIEYQLSTLLPEIKQKISSILNQQ